MPDRNALAAAAQKAFAFINGVLDELVAKSPPEFEPGINAARAVILEKAATIGPQLISTILTSLGQAVLSGDFGPASYDPTDVV